jgi:hypothetical protein
VCNSSGKQGVLASDEVEVHVGKSTRPSTAGMEARHAYILALRTADLLVCWFFPTHRDDVDLDVEYRL